MKPVAWRAWLPALLLLGVALLAVPGALMVRPGAGNRAWIDPLGPAAQDLAAVEATFGRQDGFVIAVSAADVLAPAAVAWQREATSALVALPGVVGVDGLTTAQDVVFDEQGPAPIPLLSLPRADILAHPLYRGLLVAPDGTMAALVVRLAVLDDGATVALESRVRAVLAAVPPAAGVTWQLGGLPAQQQAINRAVAADQARTVPATVLALAVLLVLVLRDWRPVLVVLAGVGGALMWTLALLGWLDRPQDALLGLLPPLVLGVGTATGLHLVWAVGLSMRDGQAPSGRGALRLVLAPLGLATLTTMAGVGGLWWGAVPAVRDFAPWAVWAVAMAALWPGLALAAALPVVPPAAWLARRRGLCGAAMETRCATLAAFCAHHRRAVMAVMLVLLAAGIVGCLRLRPDADFVRALPASDAVRQAHAAIDARLTGVLALDLVVDPGHATTAADLEALAALGAVARVEPTITNVLSLADVDALLVRRGDRRPAAERLADLELGARAVVERFRQGTALRLMARQRDGSVADAAAAAQRLATAARAVFPGAAVRVSSGALLLAETTDRLGPAVIQGLVVSLAVNALLLLIFLRSWRLALLGLILAGMPLVAVYALVPLLGWPLDVGVSMIACVALGIIMDDAIHMAYALHREGASEVAMARVGPVLIAACLALCGAFSLCALGDFAATRRFGMLLSAGFIAGLIVNLVLAPALVRVSRHSEVS
jgi:predicted RND superfamily exporter protein